MQTRLALAFANCFLEKTGQPTYHCEDKQDEELSECLKSIDSNAFTAFSNFFTHTHNMCQFLMSQIWRDNTEQTISSLGETSARAAEATRQSLDIQDTILSNQAETLNYQKQIAANGTALSQALEASRANARALMEEFRASTDEQRALIFSIFDRVGQLQSLVVSEVSWFYTIIFYVGCLLLVYLTTATRRTGDARIPLIILLTVNFCVERAICAASLYGMEGNVESSSVESGEGGATMYLFAESRFSLQDLPQVISYRIWMARKISIVFAIVVLTYFGYAFKDYNVMNNKLLQDIQRQNMELRRSLDLLQIVHQDNSTFIASQSSSFGSSVQVAHHGDSFGNRDVTDHVALPLSSQDADQEDSDSDDSTLSFNSTQTDRTWMVDAEEEKFNESFSEASSDEMESHYGDDILNDEETEFKTYSTEARLDYHSLIGGNPAESPLVENVSSTTPSTRLRRRSSRSPSLTKSTASSISTSGNYNTPRRGRRRSCTPTVGGHVLTPLIENVESSSSPLNQTCYNLRDRSKIMSRLDRWDAYDNPLLDTESPNSFGRLVAQMAKISQKNSRKVTAALEKQIKLHNETDATKMATKTEANLDKYSDDE